MPAPTQKDIDYLVAHPEVAPHFEARFQIPASNYLGRPMAKPSEKDITYLQKNPNVRPQFEQRFGDASKYLTPDADLRPDTKPQTRLQKMLDEGMNKPIYESPLQAFGRLGASILDTGEAVFNKGNIQSTIRATGETLAKIPDAVEHPGEFARGLMQGVATAPAALNDLALMGVDKSAQILGGAQPLPADAAHPLGVATAAKMYEDWGNTASDALTGTQPFDFKRPADEGAAFARQSGEIIGGAALLGGSKALMPGAGAAIGTDVAQQVAPESPGWQVIGGALGAYAPSAIARGARGTMRAAQAVPEAAVAAGEAVSTVAKPFSDKGRESVVGEALYEAAGRRVPDPDQPAVPGLAPTLGQITNNEGLLALEKTMAKSAEGVLPFKERLQENQAVAREAVTNLRGSGVPEDVRTLADRAMQVADEQAVSAERRASSGLSETQASDLARGRIESAREGMRQQRRSLWNAEDLMGDGALVDVNQLRLALGDFMSSRTKVQGRAIPKEIEEKLYQMADREPLAEIQSVRSEFGNMARQYASQGNASMADIYGGMRDVVGRFLDEQQFENPRIQEAYQAARAISRLEAGLFKQPTEMKQVLGRTPTGGQTVSPARTLEKFVRPGPAGRDTIRQVLNVDNSPEMANLIGDYIVSKIPRGTQAARDFIRKYEPTLGELPDVRQRLQSVVDARAAADALRESPLSIFAGKEPSVAIKQLLNNPDRIRAIRRLRQYMSNHRGAWDGFKAAYVDEVLRTIDSTIEQGATGNPAIKQGAVMKFYRDNADVTREILGPVGEDTLRGVANAVEMINRTSRGGYPGGSDTATMLTGHRFLDNVIAKYLDTDKGSMGSVAAGASIGWSFGGPLLGAGGALAGARFHNMFANTRTQVQALLHEALLDPAKGRALMMQASTQSLRAMPRTMRTRLKAYVSKAPKRAAALAGASQAAPDGFRKGRDGKWYGEDPSNPGKYREWSPNPFE